VIQASKKKGIRITPDHTRISRHSREFVRGLFAGCVQRFVQIITNTVGSILFSGRCVVRVLAI
jgi:hypothetical protein